MNDERITAAEFVERFERRGRIFVEKFNPKGKKKNEPKQSDSLIVEGIRFRSKLETRIAGDLIILKRAKIIQNWEYEPKFELPAKTLKREQQKSHRVDFKVVLNSGEALYLEGKGYRWRDGETRRQWVEDLYKIKVHVVETRQQAQEILLKKIKEGEFQL